MVKGLDRCITKKEVLSYLLERKKGNQGGLPIHALMKEFISFLPEENRKTNRLIGRMSNILITLMHKGLVISKNKKEIHTITDKEGVETKREFVYSVYSAR